MELEFLVVGIAKKSREDLRRLYEETAPEIFGLALSIVKDTELAADVLAETYRRVTSLAYLFNTDLSAEYWLLDMAKNLSGNVLCDPELSKKVRAPRQSNLSMLLMELINHSKEDRASILMLRSMSGLSRKDIARLLWYKTGACGKEYRRGLNRLSEKIESVDKSDLPDRICRDIKAIVPDVWHTVIQTEDSPLSHISHEELNLSASELIYSDTDKEKASKQADVFRRRRKKTLIITAIAVAVIITANLAVLLITDIIKNDSESGIVIQTGNRIAIAELGGSVFYQNIQKDNELWVYDEAKGIAQRLATDPIKEVITDGSRLYYRNLSDGYIYSVAADGTDKQRLTETPGTCLTLHEGKLYFSTASGISVIDPDGRNEEVYLTLDSQSEDVTYFTGQGLELYRYMMKFSPDGLLHFSAGAGKGLYFVQAFGDRLGLELVYSDEAYSFEVTDDFIYLDVKSYDETDDTASIKLYRLDRKTLLFAPMDGFLLGTGAFCVSGQTVYFDGIVDGEYGIYACSLDTELASPVKLSALRASDLYIQGNTLYVYYPGTESDPGAYLHQWKLEPSGQTVLTDTVIFE